MFQSATHDWQKVDYLYEFGEWLYVNEYPLQDAIDVFDWAINVLLNMKFDLPRIKTCQSCKLQSLAVFPKSGVYLWFQPRAKKQERRATLLGVKVPEDLRLIHSPEKQIKMRLKVSFYDVIECEAFQKDRFLYSVDEEGHENSEEEDDEDFVDAAQYIPVMRKAEIATNLLNWSMTMENVNGVNQLEQLMRGHVMMAAVVGCSSDKFKQSVILAHACVMRMWQVRHLQHVF